MGVQDKCSLIRLRICIPNSHNCLIYILFNFHCNRQFCCTNLLIYSNEKISWSAAAPLSHHIYLYLYINFLSQHCKLILIWVRISLCFYLPTKKKKKKQVQGGLRLPLSGIASSPRLLMCSASMGAEGSVTLQLREAVEAPDSSSQIDTTALTIGYSESDIIADMLGSIQAAGNKWPVPSQNFNKSSTSEAKRKYYENKQAKHKIDQ